MTLETLVRAIGALLSILAAVLLLGSMIGLMLVIFAILPGSLALPLVLIFAGGCGLIVCIEIIGDEVTRWLRIRRLQQKGRLQ